jgi:hypothetical protein
MSAFTTIKAGNLLFNLDPATESRIVQVIENKAGTMQLTALAEEIEEAATELGLEIDGDIVDGAIFASLLNWLDEEDLLEKI